MMMMMTVTVTMMMTMMIRTNDDDDDDDDDDGGTSRCVDPTRRRQFMHMNSGQDELSCATATPKYATSFRGPYSCGVEQSKQRSRAERSQNEPCDACHNHLKGNTCCTQPSRDTHRVRRVCCLQRQEASKRAMLHQTDSSAAAQTARGTRAHCCPSQAEHL